MKKILLILMFFVTPLMADEYIILNAGQVTSWSHRQFKQQGNYFLAELDPIFVPQLSGNRYALNIDILQDSNFITVWDELSEFPVLELTREDFQE